MGLGALKDRELGRAGSQITVLKTWTAALMTVLLRCEPSLNGEVAQGSLTPPPQWTWTPVHTGSSRITDRPTCCWAQSDPEGHKPTEARQGRLTATFHPRRRHFIITSASGTQSSSVPPHSGITRGKYRTLFITLHPRTPRSTNKQPMLI